jgi:tetratricopeptide (TPR) repeat protein
VSKGTLARKSLDVLDPLIETSPDPWLPLYCRGMNHLHWPRSLRHSDDAAADFRRCIETQQTTGDPAGRPYYERTYVALGDAYAKDGHLDDARRVWTEAIVLFPDSAALQQRLAITDARSLRRFVEDARSLQRPIDTDLSFVDR